MNTDDRTRLRRFISNNRDGWDDAGIDAALVKLDQQHPNDPLRVALIALQAAANPGCKLPEGMNRLSQEIRDQTPPPPSTPTPASLTVWCEKHGCNAKERDNGELSCCWQERTGGDNPSDPYRRAVEAVNTPEQREKLRRLAFPQRFNQEAS